MTTLVLDGLSKSYGSFKAVDGVSLTLRDGEFLSLLGPSGCGKTTTLRMIAGFIAPTAGRILLDGAEISSPRGSLPPERRGMSMIFQSYAIWPNMTVAQNVGFGLRMKRLPKEEVARRVAEILDVVKLGHLAGRYPAELSGGQQQRVALARAVAPQPKVMLLDEPLSNLDANLREDMRAEIKRMHLEFGITTVYVTHDQSEAMAISDRIAVINAGRVEQVDAPYDLYARPRTRFAAEFIGRTNLIEGRRGAGRLTFPAFSIPDPEGGSEAVLASIRPQNLRLAARGAEAAPRPGEVQLAARIGERIFLGERWDYGLTLEGAPGPTLRAAAPAEQVFDLDAPVWVSIREERIVPVEAPR
ncbi:ABC transporter ATP-binding protein [Albimonas pacifica]|uniref:Iron(III) transport system ATP-binding protein n=1 Tax=Albimonas pacifica TaxID=1114924 RepID=A0A1I3BRG8_9RHOB|nr:ABC transporter ATP-binding protein [Albimonas pacifica]SFH64887.1 iron(III) transport system ATP-binding protein [Albimonas pacifica]